MPLLTAPPEMDQEEMNRVFEQQRAHSPVLRQTTAAERIARLKRLRALILARRTELHESLSADFGKSPEEVDLSEVVAVLGEIKTAVRHLKRWMKPQRVPTPLTHFGTSSRVMYEPRGVVLIIAPWNYPFSLTFSPLVSAIAAGNCVILKPSEFTPHTSRLMKRWLAEVFEPREVALFEGDAQTAQALLALPFDHIFFTGSPAVGKLVMKAAADHLASVTLELGGKSPTLVDETADVESAARRIAWGKGLNAGQTCIAPDYVLVHARQYEAFLDALTRQFQALYGTTSDGYTRLVHNRHFQRVKGLVDAALEDGARLVSGGPADAADRLLPPQVLADLPDDTPILQEEIFGPALPVMPYASLDEALAFIHARENPLTLYLFTRSRAVIETVLRRTTAGTTCINDTLIHFANPELPFGGAGFSGIGKSHGRAGFLAFSHARGVLRQHLRHPLLEWFYPPYTPRTRTLINLLLKYF